VGSDLNGITAEHVWWSKDDANATLKRYTTLPIARTITTENRSTATAQPSRHVFGLLVLCDESSLISIACCGTTYDINEL
jgi:hypothetical protein